jgi:hypothetical protein
MNTNAFYMAHYITLHLVMIPHHTTLYHIIPHHTTLYHIIPHHNTLYHTSQICLTDYFNETMVVVPVISYEHPDTHKAVGKSVFVCLCVCVFVCLCLCVFVCLCVCVRGFILLRMYKQTRIHPRIPLLSHTQTHTLFHSLPLSLSLSLTHTFTYTHTRDLASPPIQVACEPEHFVFEPHILRFEMKFTCSPASEVCVRVL